MASRRLTFDRDRYNDKVVAYLLGLPLTIREAHAFSNIEARFPRDDDQEVMASWVVRMSLIHGSWVADELPILGAHNLATRS